MHGVDLAIRGRRVVTPDGMREACLYVSDGAIARVTDFGDLPSGVPLVDAGSHVILPGLVDTHVHVNEPGRTEWEGFETATRAAAAGGVTTIVDMPLNSIPPTTSVGALEEKRAAAEGKVHVDVGFWGGAVPDALGSLRELHEAGVFGFKAFLCPSGVDEFPPLDLDQLRAAMKEIAAFDGLLIVHAELPDELVDDAPGDPHAYATYLASRPHEAELRAIEEVVEASRDTGCRAHVLHLSAAGALEILDGAERVTAETCPHYLTFEADEIARGAAAFKCAPPIREVANRELLWAGLRDGRIDEVVSDHSPSTPDLKAGSFLDAWGGIASVELGLRAVWTGARARGYSVADVARWMSAGPAGLAGFGRKGAIAQGRAADLVVFDPDASAEVDPAELHHRNPVTPYAGRRLDGRVLATYVRGVEVYADGG
ncbi:MAG TPA: allantoinase AllB, partial [Actinomycetota bacterium]|nr:allantoinase AllB [Actinomycetota bacterium]